MQSLGCKHLLELFEQQALSSAAWHLQVHKLAGAFTENDVQGSKHLLLKKRWTVLSSAPLSDASACRPKAEAGAPQAWRASTCCSKSAGRCLHPRSEMQAPAAQTALAGACIRALRCKHLLPKQRWGAHPKLGM
jgi:hypothetical protein